MPNENKKIVQDVVRKERSIRDIEIPSRKARDIDVKKMVSKPLMRPEIQPVRKAPIPPPPPPPKPFPPKRPEPTDYEYNYHNEPVKEPVVEKIGVPSYTYEYDEPIRKSRKGLYIAGGLFVIVLAFGISAFFKSATVTITPRHETHTLNTTFTAKKDDTGNNLGFQVVSTSKTVEKKVTATGQAKVTTKASGTIVIFNNYSTASQKLVATTRFQTGEGLIFRLPTAVIVPGRQVIGGKVTPGSIEVKVVADAVGESYNIGLKDFTIPGFKGDPRYSQIYARSKTAMSGGFNGMQKIISPDILSSTDSELQSQLKSSLSTDIVSQIPTNFVLYDQSMTTVYSPATQVDGGDGTAVIRKKGTSYAIIFDKGSLSRAIIGQVLASTTGDTIKITNLEKLTFAYPDGKAFDPSGTGNTMTFALTGDANFVWTLDENKLQSDLLGLSKSQATKLLGTYSAIQEAWITTSPFWNTTIPKNQNKITLINTLAQ